MKTYTRDDTVHGQEYVLRAEAEAEIRAAVESERERHALDVHSCHPHCTKAGCVNERLRGLLDDAYAQIRRQAALMASAPNVEVTCPQRAGHRSNDEHDQA